MKGLFSDQYTVRRGVALSAILGKYYLVSARPAWNYCPKAREINEAAADVWKMFCEELPRDKMILKIMQKYGISRQEAGTRLSLFAAQLESQGYLVRKHENDE